MVSSTMSSIVYGAGGADDGATPRLSKVTTWYPASVSAGIMAKCQPTAGWLSPHTSTTGSPEAGPNTS